MRSFPYKYRLIALVTLLTFTVTNSGISYAGPSTMDHGSWTTNPSIPPALGSIESFVPCLPSLAPCPTIYYIQDAHDSLEAQENIAKLIHYLVEHEGVKTVFEEGYEGPVPTEKYFGAIKDPIIREKAAYFLMDKLRLGGAEYAAIVQRTENGKQKTEKNKKSENQKGSSTSLRVPLKRDEATHEFRSFNLIGADSLKLHKENIRWYQKTARLQKKTERDLNELEAALLKLIQKKFPAELKEWIKLKEQFEKGQVGLPDYLKRLRGLWQPPKASLAKGGRAKGEGEKPSALSPLPYANIQLLLEMKSSSDLHQLQSLDAAKLWQEIGRFENDFAAKHLKDSNEREIFTLYKSVRLLKRLNRLEVSEEEYQAAKDTLKEIDTPTLARFLADESRKTVVLSKVWEQNIQNAFGFYETAKAREGAVEKIIMGKGQRAESKGGNPSALTPMPPAVLVFGGFHKEGIKEILRRNGFSYYVITPKITAVSQKHQNYYKQLMRMGYENAFFPKLLAGATTAFRTLEFREPFLSQVVNQAIQIAQETLGSTGAAALPEMDLAFRKRHSKTKRGNFLKPGYGSRRSEARFEGINQEDLESAFDELNNIRENEGEAGGQYSSILAILKKLYPSGFEGLRGLEVGITDNAMLLFRYLKAQGAQMTGVGYDIDLDDPRLIQKSAKEFLEGYQSEKFDFVYAYRTLTKDSATANNAAQELDKTFRKIYEHLEPGGYLLSVIDASERDAMPKPSEIKAMGFEIYEMPSIDFGQNHIILRKPVESTGEKYRNSNGGETAPEAKHSETRRWSSDEANDIVKKFLELADTGKADWAGSFYKYYLEKKGNAPFDQDFNEAVNYLLSLENGLSLDRLKGLSWVLSWEEFMGTDVLGLIYGNLYEAGETILYKKILLTKDHRIWMNQMIEHVLRLEKDHQSAAYQRARYVRGPETFAGYHVKEIMGQGGYKTVYRVEKEGHTYILKRFLSGIGLDDRFFGTKDRQLEGFRRDISVMADLTKLSGKAIGQYVPKLIESGQFEGDDYYVMEEIRGQTFTSYVNAHPQLNIMQRLKLFRKILAAIAAFHEAGWVHQDLKPLNIMITEDEKVKIIDFETTRKHGESRSGNEASAGTKGLRPPEQFLVGYTRSYQWDIVQDVYPLGMVLFFYILWPLTPSSDRYSLYPTFANDYERFRAQEVSMDFVGRVYFGRSFTQTTPEMLWENLRIKDEQKVSIREEILELTIKAADLQPSKRYKTMKELDEAVDSVLNKILKALVDKPSRQEENQEPRSESRTGAQPLALSTEQIFRSEAREEKVKIDPVIGQLIQDDLLAAEFYFFTLQKMYSYLANSPGLLRRAASGEFSRRTPEYPLVQYIRRLWADRPPTGYLSLGYAHNPSARLADFQTEALNYELIYQLLLKTLKPEDAQQLKKKWEEWSGKKDKFTGLLMQTHLFKGFVFPDYLLNNVPGLLDLADHEYLHLAMGEMNGQLEAGYKVIIRDPEGVRLLKAVFMGTPYQSKLEEDIRKISDPNYKTMLWDEVWVQTVYPSNYAEGGMPKHLIIANRPAFSQFKQYLQIHSDPAIRSAISERDRLVILAKTRTAQLREYLSAHQPIAVEKKTEATVSAQEVNESKIRAILENLVKKHRFQMSITDRPRKIKAMAEYLAGIPTAFTEENVRQMLSLGSIPITNQLSKKQKGEKLSILGMIADDLNHRLNRSEARSYSQIKIEEMTIPAAVIVDWQELARMGPEDFRDEINELLILLQQHKGFHVFLENGDKESLSKHANFWVQALAAETKVTELKRTEQLNGKPIVLRLRFFQGEANTADMSFRGEAEKSGFAAEISPPSSRRNDIKEIISLQAKFGAVTAFLKAAESALKKSDELKENFEEAVLRRIADKVDGLWKVKDSFLDSITALLKNSYETAIAA